MAWFISVALKSQNFAQLLEDIAQTCIFTSSALERGGGSVGTLLGQSQTMKIVLKENCMHQAADDTLDFRHNYGSYLA